MEGYPTQAPVPHRGLATTCWTVVRACAQNGGGGHEARATLCGRYWYPVYAHICRQGHSGFDAEDLTQDFFAYILKRPWFAQADRTRGRFRSFLLVSLDHFLRDRFAREQTLKRGRQYQHVPLELVGDGLSASSLDEARQESERRYDAVWAAAVVGAALQRLENEQVLAKPGVCYADIKGFLTVEGSQTPYEAAARLRGVSVEQLKGAIHRLRRRYGDILREEVARTVACAGDVTDELRHLRAALAAGA